MWKQKLASTANLARGGPGASALPVAVVECSGVRVPSRSQQMNAARQRLAMTRSTRLAIPKAVRRVLIVCLVVGLHGQIVPANATELSAAGVLLKCTGKAKVRGARVA